MSRLLTQEELEAWENHFARNASEQPEEALMVSRLIAEIRRLGRDNAKLPRYVELEVKIEEQRAEIERLRAENDGEPSSALSVEQMVRNILEANGVEDAQALSSGDIVGPANLLASYLTEAATQSMAKSMTRPPDDEKRPETPKVPGPARS